MKRGRDLCSKHVHRRPDRENSDRITVAPVLCPTDPGFALCLIPSFLLSVVLFVCLMPRVGLRTVVDAAQAGARVAIVMAETAVDMHFGGGVLYAPEAVFQCTKCKD